MALSPTSSRGSSGGTPTAKTVDLGVVSAVALAASGRRTLYTTGAGEFIAALRFGDAAIANDGVADLVFEAPGWTIVSVPYGLLSAGALDFYDSTARGIRLSAPFNAGNLALISKVSPGLLSGVLSATLSVQGDGTTVEANPSWQANHAYAATTAIIAVGHYWDNFGAGTSAGSTPNFAAHLGGNVVDGGVTWFDQGTVATQGSLHAYAEIWTPATP